MKGKISQFLQKMVNIYSELHREKNLFLGFEVLTKEDKDSDIQFPEELVENETLDFISESTEQKFTLPPNRYSEASLIKRMEERV